jgi:hypothetical protein
MYKCQFRVVVPNLYTEAHIIWSSFSESHLLSGYRSQLDISLLPEDDTKFVGAVIELRFSITTWVGIHSDIT